MHVKHIPMQQSTIRRSAAGDYGFRIETSCPVVVIEFREMNLLSVILRRQPGAITLLTYVTAHRQQRELPFLVVISQARLQEMAV